MFNRTLLTTLLIALAVLFSGYTLLSAAPAQNQTDRLAIVWTSGDPDVAHRMTLMYANGAQKNKWFDEVRLIIWGPSQRLVVGDKDVRAYVERLVEAGVDVKACQACADSFGIADDLRKIPGVQVKYMGKPLSNFLKDDQWKVITF